MKAEIIKYFEAEKSESLVFLAIGVTAIIAGVYFGFFTGKSFYKGFAIPLILIGIIQVVVGSTVYFRTDSQASELTNLYEKNPTTFATQELPRMETVNRNFVIYRWVEIAFMVIGIGLLFLKEMPFWRGIGLGMLIQGALMLSADYFAERRAHVYVKQITAFQNTRLK